jgi:hypothetical protein
MHYVPRGYGVGSQDNAPLYCPDPRTLAIGYWLLALLLTRTGSMGGDEFLWLTGQPIANSQ